MKKKKNIVVFMLFLGRSLQFTDSNRISQANVSRSWLDQVASKITRFITELFLWAFLKEQQTSIDWERKIIQQYANIKPDHDMKVYLNH